ncbi:dTDP-4-amino-4,6-dideoxygalactose transaminase [Rhizobiales bacterium GAS188]|nr:dTDP-4-amino-4,6-dideoxygalactose transaminase [Rhizobiales bacterium GAS188]
MLLVAEPILGEDEKAALCDVVDSGWITMADRVREFEKAFAAKHGAEDAVAVSSCTAALHLILDALDIGPGDEVLVPSLTFVATANCVLYVGATPVFVDIESLELPLMSRTDAAAKCTSKTKAIILVHYAGYLVDRQAWRDFADSRGLLLIEDAAHAAGADQAGKFGHAAAFSFYGNKNMTTAEGGAVIASDPEVLAKVRQMRGHGMTSGTFQRLSSRTPTYDVTMLGYNYRMDEFRAAVGLIQLAKLDEWNDSRRHLTRHYVQSLQERCPSVCLPFANWHAASNHISAHHIMPIVLPKDTDRQRVVEKLRDAQIQTTIHYPPVHRFSFYRGRFPLVRLPVTEEFARRELTLPLHPRMGERDVEMVSAELAGAIADSVPEGALL